MIASLTGPEIAISTHTLGVHFHAKVPMRIVTYDHFSKAELHVAITHPSTPLSRWWYLWRSCSSILNHLLLDLSGPRP